MFYLLSDNVQYGDLLTLDERDPTHRLRKVRPEAESPLEQWTYMSTVAGKRNDWVYRDLDGIRYDVRHNMKMREVDFHHVSRILRSLVNKLTDECELPTDAAVIAIAANIVEEYDEYLTDQIVAAAERQAEGC